MLAADDARALAPRLGIRRDLSRVSASRARAPEPAPVDGSFAHPRLATWFTPAVAAILVCVFALLLLPAPHRNWGEIAVAAVAAVALVAGSSVLRLAPRLVGIAAPVAFLLIVVLLRDASGGSTSGFGGFFLLPVIYFALLYGIGEVLLGLSLIGLASAVPILLFGAPDYPLTSWRGTVVQLVVAAIAGLTIQRLVMHVRTDAASKEQQNRELLTLDRMKDEFMSVISHEFRTPLTSINGYLGLVTEEAQDSLSEEHLHFLATVERNVSRLQHLVEDILFVARIEHAGLEAQPTGDRPRRARHRSRSDGAANRGGQRSRAHSHRCGSAPGVRGSLADLATDRQPRLECRQVHTRWGPCHDRGSRTRSRRRGKRQRHRDRDTRRGAPPPLHPVLPRLDRPDQPHPGNRTWAPNLPVDRSSTPERDHGRKHSRRRNHLQLPAAAHHSPRRDAAFIASLH